MSKKVLIVEDEARLAMALNARLEQEGLSIVRAKNGQEGLGHIKANGIGLVLLDLLMPVMDGVEFLGQIRELDNGKTMPVLIITNLGEAEAREKLGDLEVTDVFVKAEEKIEDIVAKAKEILA